MTELPSGTVTFLFSDIEGSTRLVKALRERYAQVLAEHRRLVRAAIASHAGHEIDTQGDAFFVAFASAKQAVLCALEVQRALAGHEWPASARVRVRMGIHTGQAIPVEGAYTGLAVHRAARICAVARGGQVLLSQATQTIIEDEEEEEELGLALVELGERRLKDLDRPVRLFELAAAGLDAPAPSVRAVPEPQARDTTSAATQSPIVGRAAELEIISAAYARVLAGQSQVMLITGEAGIGKTRLVEELTDRVRSAADGARVRVGESAPMAGAALAYGPFVAALGDEAGWLLADDNAGDMLAARHRLFVRVLELLASLAARSPLVLVLEDLHWADESSRELLAFLAVRLREEPVMMVGTLREEELTDAVRRWLTELEHRPRVTRLRLGRMADTEIAGLVAEAMPTGASSDQVAVVVAAADGNPLYARELANADPGGSAASITDAVLARVAGLPMPARAVVDQICVADGGMSHELLAATVDLPEKRLLAAARRAIAAGLLVTIGDSYAFPHDLIRQTLYGHLLPGERQRLHRRLAGVLAARAGSNPSSLAQHWHLAGCPDRAAPAALAAARDAVLARAYPEALRCYALAVGLSAYLPESGPGLLEEAAQAASWAGNPQRAAGWAADALSQSSAAVPADQARLLERLGRYRWESGDLMAALDATGQALELIGHDPPSTLQARVLAADATLRMLIGELDEALPLATRAIAVAEQAGAAAEHAHGLATLGIIQAQHGDLDAGLAALDTSFELARRARSAEDVVRAAANHMYLLCSAGRFTEALAVARAGRQAAMLLDTPTALTSVLDNNTAAVLVTTGQWEEADRLLAELLSEASGNAARYLQLQQLELAVGRGETQRAAELAASLRKAPHDPRLIGQLHACLAEQALNTDDVAMAAGEVLDGLLALEGAALAADEIRLLAAGARVSADLASPSHRARLPRLPDQWEPAAATFADRAAAITHADGSGQPEVAAYGAQVAVEQAREHGNDHSGTWRAVADAWKVAGQPYREAYARLREAEAAIRAGRRDQAAHILETCEVLALALSAAPLLCLAKELARRTKLTIGPAASRSTAADT